MIVSASRLRDFKAYLKEHLLFNNEPTSELFAILSVYFVQGILGMARLAVSFFLKDDLGLSPAQLGALMGIVVLPWIVKPLLGFLSDGVPIAGYHRRPYLILSGILGTASWLALATLVRAPWSATLALLATSFSVALSDVIVDSLVVERARRESLGQSGSLQSLTWGISAVGGILTAYLSGWLLEHFSTRTVFEMTAIFPLVVVAIAGLIAEDPVSPSSKEVANPLRNTSQQLQLLWKAIRQKSIFLPTLFVFLWQATPSADSAFFYFTTNELGFEPEFLGRVRLVTSLAALIGIWVYQRYLKSVPFRSILGWSIVISAVLGMSTLLLVTHANRTLGIDDRWFSLGDNLILTVMGQIAFMPILVLSARLCPPGIEASLFALLMSIWNLSGLVSTELGSLLTHWLGITEQHFDSLWLLVVIANLSTLLPLFLLGWLPDGDPQAERTPQLPPAEVYERRTPGAIGDAGLMPELLPEWVSTPEAIAPNRAARE